ncbi:MAG TPA: hypothetical protein VF250_15365 [Conexibacter sp.]
MTAAAMALGALTSSAASRNLSISSQTLRSNFRELRFEGLFGNTVCQVTMEASFHSRTMAKVVGQLIGYVTAFGLGPCATGTATVLNETLPWHIRYRSFAGTLPDITDVNLDVIGFSIRARTPEGFNCLTTGLLKVLEVATKVVGLIGAVRGLFGGGRVRTSCGIDGTISTDLGPVRLPITSELIFVRLI